MANWIKASASTSAQGCVQVRSTGVGLTEIGDTKNPHGPTITIPNADWTYFLDQVAEGRADYRRLVPHFLPGGGFTLIDTVTNTPDLTYTRAEWDSFKAGAQAGELRTPDPRGVLVG